MRRLRCRACSSSDLAAMPGARCKLGRAGREARHNDAALFMHSFHLSLACVFVASTASSPTACPPFATTPCNMAAEAGSGAAEGAVFMVTGGTGLYGRALQKIVAESPVEGETWHFLSSKDADLR